MNGESGRKPRISTTPAENKHLPPGIVTYLEATAGFRRAHTVRVDWVLLVLGLRPRHAHACGRDIVEPYITVLECWSHYLALLTSCDDSRRLLEGTLGREKIEKR